MEIVYIAVCILLDAFFVWLCIYYMRLDRLHTIKYIILLVGIVIGHLMTAFAFLHTYRYIIVTAYVAALLKLCYKNIRIHDVFAVATIYACKFALELVMYLIGDGEGGQFVHIICLSAIATIPIICKKVIACAYRGFSGQRSMAKYFYFRYIAIIILHIAIILYTQGIMSAWKGV